MFLLSNKTENSQGLAEHENVQIETIELATYTPQLEPQEKSRAIILQQNLYIKSKATEICSCLQNFEPLQKVITSDMP